MESVGHKQGLIDELTTAETWREDAARLALQPAPNRTLPLLDRLMTLAPVRPLVASQLRKQVAAKLNPDHYPAPFAMIDLWRRKGASLDSYTAETESFVKLVGSPTSRNLVRVFFLQDRLKKLGKRCRST